MDRRPTIHNSVSGERFETLLLPRVSLTHEGMRAALAFDADAEIVKSLSGEGELRLAAINASSAFDYALDSLTVFSAGASLRVSQAAADDPITPGDPDAVISASQSISGVIDAALSRQFGRFDVALRGSLGRTVYGPTTYATPPVVDNSDSNVTIATGGIRVGFEMTPILTLFADGSVERNWFDGVSSTLLVKPDGTTYTGKVGIAGKWNEVFEAEASVGFALRRFDAASLSEVVGTLYNASITFRPDTDWTLRAAFSTDFVPPGPEDTGTARIEYDATADVSYLVNQWLTLRASAAWYATDLPGSTDTETGYGVGLGADYLVGDHVVLNADYAFTHDEISPDPTEDAHRVTLGITLKR
jgi:hypothetical protein